MIDTHTHLNDTAFGDIDGQVAAVDRATAAGVHRMLLAGVDPASIEPMRALAALRPQALRRAMALHPTELGDDWHANLAIILKELTEHADEYVAVGECGIDLYWDKSTLEAQMQVFDAQLSYAGEHKLPVLIHCREALPQTLEVLSGHPGVEAVFHSFGGSVDDVEAIGRVGDYRFGINGIVTFKNSGLKKVLPAISRNRILLETDSPYLTPVPYRGKRNESSYLPYVAAAVADALGISIEEVDALTTANALAFIPAL